MTGERFTSNARMDTIDVTINTFDTESSEADLGGFELLGMQMPAGFTGTEITFLGNISKSGTADTALYNALGQKLTVTGVGVYRIIMFNPGDFLCIRKLKLVSGDAQDAVRVIKLIVRPLL